MLTFATTLAFGRADPDPTVYFEMMQAFAVATEPLNPQDLVRLVSEALVEARPEAVGPGAVATFLGLVRDQTLGRRVVRLEYEAYEPLAVRVFEQIAAEAAQRWPQVRLALHHRIGALQIGEASVALAAAAPHRADAFAACRYAIERVKQIAPIWKREHFEDGDVWVEGATADPDDAAAREAAYRRACA